ncbi:cell wall-binding repeat-containing protein [Salisediminibacterium halotolerans]|uniref:Cell wall binding repeat 2 n=1 Tax=Salisediminibacterium halotolerans TaxID=517425 RepID=A0A1H9WKN9_9BACI|nr:cell wall-binding repeat-containing protein [Salisediminibacterium haloalkalitolerans]SES34502.1 hypothetical protein SAMN05444126_1387 [Salisediminibacterium haloalkalitolerans]
MKKFVSRSAALSLPLFFAACADNEPAENQADDNADSDNQQYDMSSNEETAEENMNNHNNEGNNGSGHGHDEEQHEEFASEPDSINEEANADLRHQQTKNVTRMDTDSPSDMALYISQLVWPATHEDNQPGTVILAPEDEWQKSLAATTLIHHPNDGPVLLMEDGMISAETINEIERLNPKGNENGTEVMIMGSAEEETLSELDNYATEHFDTESVPEFTAEIDEYFAELSGEAPETVFIASSKEEAQLFSLITGSWIAHMDEPLLYVDDDGVPDATAEALEARDGDASMYVFGTEELISEDTLNELNEYGDVDRIAGETPEEMSIEFAKYRSDDELVGWGQEEPGHGLNFVSTENPQFAISGSALGHLGKHAPLIWLEDGEISAPLYEYMAEIRPVFEDDPMDGPYNHAYLLASQETVPFQTQGIIDEKLEIYGGHGGH